MYATLSDPLGAASSVADVKVSRAHGSPAAPSPVGDTPAEQAQASVGLNIVSEESIQMNSIQPTMWIGTQSGK